MKSAATLVLLAGMIVTTPSFAADATGTWSGTVKLPTGQELPFVAHLTESGETVTGTLDGINGGPSVSITDGRNDKDTITFDAIRQIQGAPVKFHYTGQLHGNSMDITIARADGTGTPGMTHTTRSAS